MMHREPKDVPSAIKTVFSYKKKFFRYIIAGGIALLTDLALLYFCTEVLKIWYIFSSIIAFAVSFFVAFTLQKFWTFDNRSIKRIKKQLAMSFSVALLNLALNTFFMYVLTEYFSLHYFLAQIVTTGIIAIESFLVYQYVIFLSKPEDK